jgi:quercetin dioxygenase-like cupin family protein
MGFAALNNPAYQKGSGYMFVSAHRFIRPAFALFGFIALAAAFHLGTVAAQAPATKVTQLMKQTLGDVPSREAMMIILDIPPAGGSPVHRHPGAHIFGYVLEGAYKTKIDGGPETILTKGQTFYEAPGQLHAVSSNASNTEPAKVLVVAVNEIGKPLTVPEKP